MVKDCEELKKEKRMPKKANRLRRRFTLIAELVARKTTPRNDVGKAVVRISSLNVLGLKTHNNNPDLKIQKPQYNATSSDSQSTTKKNEIESWKSTIELKFKVGDIELHEIMIVMENRGEKGRDRYLDYCSSRDIIQ